MAGHEGRGCTERLGSSQEGRELNLHRLLGPRMFKKFLYIRRFSTWPDALLQESKDFSKLPAGRLLLDDEPSMVLGILT